MLRGMRKASENWLGRIVMAAVMFLLAGVFGLWGINDIFTGFGRSTLAKIGNTEIGIAEFQQQLGEFPYTCFDSPCLPEQGRTHRKCCHD